MSFIHPDRLWLLVIIPIMLVITIIMQRGRSKAWKRLVAPRHMKQLVVKESNPLRWISFAFALLGCALMIAVIARPFKGVTTTIDQISSRNIIIAIDTSRSMLVQDGSPNRMTTAKAIALEMLEAFPNDRVGVVAFSGVPLLMAPLTVDHGAVQEIIGQLDTSIIPRGGSDLAAAAVLSIETFAKTGQKSNALIIISDGEDHSVETGLAAEEIQKAGIRVCAISVGTADGGIIPDYTMRDGKFRDNRGKIVRSKMNPDALQQISNIGRGTYLPASSGADRVISSALASLENEEQEGLEASVPNERYHWFLLPAVICLVLSLILGSKLKPRTRNAPALGLILFALTILPQQSHAATQIEIAQEAYSKKDYAKAITAFKKALPEFKGSKQRGIQFSIATSAYRLKKYDEAIRYFSKSLLSENRSLQEQSHYSLGNSLFHSSWDMMNPEEREKAAQQLSTPETAESEKKQPNTSHAIVLLEDAITHYNAALDINPKNEDAEHNLKEGEKNLEELKKKEQQEQDKQEQEEQENESEEDKEGEEEKGEEESEKGEDGEEEGENQEEEGEDEGEESENEGEEGDQQSESDPSQQGEEGEQSEQQEGESDEEFAARILEEQSDLETRPVPQRLRYQKRPAKDW